MEGLLYAHDRIAEQSTVAAPPGDADSEMEGGVPPESAFISASSAAAHPADKTFKIIRLEKSNEPLVNLPLTLLFIYRSIYFAIAYFPNIFNIISHYN